MHTLLFLPRFTPLVAAGVKRQTIRRASEFRVGDKMRLCTAHQDPGSGFEFIATATCTRVARVLLSQKGIVCDGVPFYQSGLGAEWMHGFAVREGFASWVELAEWFSHHYALPFDGVLIVWTLDTDT